jgi:predicted ATPase/DNA-binding CsgD family transcriptional regulator
MGAATTARAPLGNLPAEVTSFIGRRHELAEARRLLSAARLVTLTGPGGVGKTRLAQRVGAEARRAFADGVWLVELAELRDPELLAVTVADALGIREESVRWGAGSLAAYLAGKQMLLVLDNCEQIITACAELAGALLRSCPDLRILATSRQQLGIAGEAMLTVRPLSVPDGAGELSPAALAQYESANLLVERASAVLPEFTLDEGNSAAVTQLLQALEGMPLAIELAAVRLRVLSLEQIVARLADRYRLLSSGNRTAPARQQTLKALIDWSYDLCSEAERRLWARLSVFSGGTELGAAEEICGGDDLPPESILDVVASLVDKSILMRVDQGSRVRYRMLEAIREYGEGRLQDTGEELEFRRRHCHWYANLARRGDAHWASSDQVDLMRRLRHEQGNLRVALEFAMAHEEPELALRFAADLENHWFVRGYLAEGRHWLDRALALPARRHWTRAKALRVNAWLAAVQGDAEHASRMLDEACELAIALPEPIELAYATHIRGNVAMFAGDMSTALRLFENAYAGFRAIGARGAEMWALAVLGLTRGFAGDPRDGFAELQASIDLAAAHGEVWWRSFALWALSVLQWLDGDPATATITAKASLEVRRRVEDEQFGVGLSLEALAWIACRERRDQRAAELLGASARLWRAMRASLSVFTRLEALHEACVRELGARLGPDAFEAAMARGAALSTEEAVALALEQQKPASPAPASGGGAVAAQLTRREREVAALIAEGLSNREIAARLVVAQRTAEGHVENILSKLGFTSRAQVAAWMTAQAPPAARP